MKNNDMKGGGGMPSKITHGKPSKTTNPSAKIPGGVPVIKTGAKADKVTFKSMSPNHKNGDFSS